jgi:hypothetical protein
MIALFLSLAPVTGTPAETGDEETAATQANTGAESITIDAGKKAGVPFPHRRHQTIESVACNTCHDLFPQTSGSIASLKAEGTLGRKQVMKDLCISCHKETAKAEKPSGPTSCKVCHSG